MHTIAQDISHLAEHLPAPTQAELLDFAQYVHLLQVGKQLAELGGTQSQLESIPRIREAHG